MWKHGIGEVSVDMILERADVLKGASTITFLQSRFAARVPRHRVAPARRSNWLILRGGSHPGGGTDTASRDAGASPDRRQRPPRICAGTFNMSMPTSLLREERDHRQTARTDEFKPAVFGERPSADRDKRSLPTSVEATARLLSLCDVRASVASRMNNSLKPLDIQADPGRRHGCASLC